VKTLVSDPPTCFGIRQLSLGVTRSSASAPPSTRRDIHERIAVQVRTHMKRPVKILQLPRVVADGFWVLITGWVRYFRVCESESCR
jgi:hypothetical protein